MRYGVGGRVIDIEGDPRQPGKGGKKMEHELNICSFVYLLLSDIADWRLEAERARYRREALPQMANTILELDRMTEEGEAAILRLEKGQTSSPAIDLDTGN